MNPTEPKNAFLLMRANGWSLRSISDQLGIPKSTLFDWESDAPTRRTINVLKSLQVEKLQEQYIPSFEEELQKLSTLLSRLEGALSKQDFDEMRPEFLLRTSLQVRSRLNKFRSNIQPTHTLNDGELPPVPLPGCISRSETIGDSGESRSSSPSPLSGEAGDGAPSPSGRGQGEGEGTARLTNSDTPESTGTDRTNPDKNENVSQPDPSTTTTSNGQNRTPVRIPSHQPGSSFHDASDEIAFTAAFGPPREPAMAT